MTKTPIAVESANLADHAAVRAWRHLHAGPAPVTVELWRRHATKPDVHRLTFADGAHPAVFAKRAPAGRLALERRIYAELLPDLPLTRPRYYGFHAAEDGTAWLFTEDVGAERMSPLDPAQRAAAAEWLGTLHAAAADRPAPAWLPDAGPARYLDVLRAGSARLRRGGANRALSADDRATLDATLGLLDALESRWPRIARACAGPATLVHGDFRPKNVRVRHAGGAPSLYPIDWELAGWGVPAADLASAPNLGRTPQLDGSRYEAIVRRRWPELDAAAIARLSVVGLLFRGLAGIAWECEALVHESPRHLEAPIASMRVIAAAMSDGLATAEWLR